MSPNITGARREDRATVRRPVRPKPRASGADQPLRQSGIRVVGEVPWGGHICVFYETRDDLLDTAAAYFKAGLASNEFCIWAISEPITEADAMAALRRAIPELPAQLAAGRIEIIPGIDWYLPGNEFDLQRITGGWSEKLRAALAKGFDGMRVSGNAFWIASNHWQEFCQYEHELDSSLDGQRMVVLCTYSLQASRAVDLLDVARAHNYCIARRKGDWEFLATPELRQARQEIERLCGALGVLSKRFPGDALLTPRERVVLAQIVRGASSKEAARMLAISPRTIEFHRTNVMRKLGARNTADLVRRVLGD